MRKLFVSGGLAALLIVGLLATLAFIPAANAATITSVQAAVTKTAAFDGTGLDVSGLSGDFTLKLHVSNMSSASATPTAAFCFEYVAAADFTTPYYAWCVQVDKTSASADKVWSIKSSSLPDVVALSWGQTNGKIRLSLIRIGGTTPTVTYDAWLEQ